MNESDYHKLRLKQTELFVARQILDAHKMYREQNIYIDPMPAINIAAGITPRHDSSFQHTGLQRLTDKGLIQVLNANGLLAAGIKIQIIDMTALKTLFTELHESIPSIGYCARIIYSRKTGSGKVNGKPFKLNRGSRNRKVFGYMVKNPNKYISKENLWVVAGEKGKFTEDADKINEFNTIITTLRKALKGIAPEHLRLKKSVFLDAEVTLTD